MFFMTLVRTKVSVSQFLTSSGISSVAEIFRTARYSSLSSDSEQFWFDSTAYKAKSDIESFWQSYVVHCA